MTRDFPVPLAVPLLEQVGQTLPSLVTLMQTLLGEGGCPWDRAQTMTSLCRYVIEEACEVIDAVRQGEREPLIEELGDLLLQVVFLAELGRKDHNFGPDDVVLAIVKKLVRRHPHVFGSEGGLGIEEVEQNWEKLKSLEKVDRPLLDNIPRSLPALDGARRLSERAASVGFDWPEAQGSRAKVAEEMEELDEAVAIGTKAQVEHEFGDVLFALVNYARHLGLDPEEALRKTSARFRQRFEHVEDRVKSSFGDWPREEGKATRGISLSVLDAFWDEAKQLESTKAP
jgi:MazG family protein